MGIFTALLVPKAIDKAFDYISDAWDECFDGEGPKFTIKQIALIKKCRRDLNISDRELTFELNNQLDLNLTVEDYSQIW